MRRFAITLGVGATLLAPAAFTAAPVAAQSLAARVAAAPADATVRFQFQPKPGVCGDGESLMIRGDGDRGGMTIIQHGSGNSYSTSSGRIYGDNRIENCREGPVVVELTRAGRRITSSTARIGGVSGSNAVDLGTADPRDVVDFLLSEEALRAERRAAERMIFTATLAPVETWPSLLRVARLQSLDNSARSTAMFWLAQAAGEKASAGLVSIIGNDSDELEVRKQAVFALSRISGADTVTELMRIARTNREPEIRRTAMFWLGRSSDPRVVGFFEEILRG